MTRVRPLIDERTISDNIHCVKENGSTITCTLAKETVVLVDEMGRVADVPEQKKTLEWLQAPQSFWLKDILDVDERAIKEGHTDMIDSLHNDACI